MKKADKCSSAGVKNDSSTVVIKEPKYTIGVDTCDENANAYCLVSMVDEKMEVILANTNRDKKIYEYLRVGK
jgi:hypothetical protein